MLPLPGPGFRGQLRAGFGGKANSNGPKSAPKLPEPEAGQFGTGFVLAFRQNSARKTCPGSPAPRLDRLVTNSTSIK